MTASVDTRTDAAAAVANLIRFLETGTAPDGLFAPDVLSDVSVPQWRVQADTEPGLLAIRAQGHPFPGEVHVERVEHTDHGFTMEFEERWDQDGQRWYSREMIRADVVGASIVELAVYCTGDWDEARRREHAEAVRLARP
jgi:hypothetical protein